MSAYFILAGSLAIGTVLVHCIRGGRRVVAPMLVTTELNDTIKAVLYGCWHAFTLLYLSVAAGFYWAAGETSALSLAYMGTYISAILAVISAGVIIRFRQRFLRLPHWLMFSLVAGAGLMGLAE